MQSGLKTPCFYKIKLNGYKPFNGHMNTYNTA